jgi:hypothetical protein
MYQGLGDETVLNYPGMPDFTPVASASPPVSAPVDNTGTYIVGGLVLAVIMMWPSKRESKEFGDWLVDGK